MSGGLYCPVFSNLVNIATERLPTDTRLSLKRLIVLLLALLAWAYPIHAASALLSEPKLEEPIQLTYGPYVNERTFTSIIETAQRQEPNASAPLDLSKKANSSIGYSGRNYSKEEVQQLIRDYSTRYGINSDTPLCIAKHESGFNQFSKNRHSTASGVFQYLSGTWKSTDEGKTGLSVFQADANIQAAVKYMAVHKNTRPWVVRSKCPPLQIIN